MIRRRTESRTPRIALAVAMVLLTLIVQGAQPAPVSVVASNPVAGAPPAGSGTKTTPPFVRVLDGKSIETYLDNDQVDIVIVGIDVPSGSSACGEEATRQLTLLAKGGLILDEDSTITFDALHRRVYSARTHDGRIVAEELVKAGVARVNGVGEPNHQYTAAEADARAAKRGCLWNGGQVPKVPTAKGVGKTAGSGTTLPDGFRQDVLSANLIAPTGFIFLPDGRILVTEQRGRVRLIKNGVLQTTPLLDIHDRVNNYGDRGLIGMAADPNFATNGYLYLLYVYENDPNSFDGTKTSRLGRFTVVGDSASPASELAILGTAVGTSCDIYAVGTDCLPSDGASHSMGSLRFASDGTLFVSTGDASSFTVVDDNALRAQNPDYLSGKLLHITTSGVGVSTNPFWTGDPRANRSKVWAYGFRNPFRFQLRPGSDTPYIGDVGWVTWEEINVGVKGGNYGWPCYEGNLRQDGYAPKSVCQTLYSKGASAVQLPLTTYNHNNFGAAAVGGVFYTGTNYPAQYRGAYFYGDYALSEIRTLTVNGSNALTGGPTGFATNADAPVDFSMGPDGDLYYLAYAKGELRHIIYATAPDAVLAKASASIQAGPTPLPVQFSSAGTTGPTGVHLYYDWDFDDGASAHDQPNPAHTYTVQGVYSVVLYVYDGSGNPPATSLLTIKVGTPPTVAISSPSSSLTYAVGDTITYAGSATDIVDGDLPGPQLGWQIILHHCPGGVCHTHNFLTTAGSSGTFVVPDHGDDSYFELILTAVDGAGLTSTTSVSIHPKTVQVTLTTVPAGMQVVYNGTTYTAPVTITTIPGSIRTINTPGSQGIRTFSQWSDNGAIQHDITIGSSDATYTATFGGGPPAPRAPGTSGAPVAPEPTSRPANPSPSSPNAPPNPIPTGR